MNNRGVFAGTASVCAKILIAVAALGICIREAKAADSIALNLEGSVRMALDRNLGYERVHESIGLSESDVRSARSRFIPQADVFADYTNERNEDLNERTQISSAGVGVTENLVTGASISADVATVWRDENDANVSTGGHDFFTSADVAVRQPLLRGGFVKIATAPLVNARRSLTIDQMDLNLDAQQLVVEVYSGYYGLVKEELIKGTREIELEIAERALKNATMRKGLGDASGLDVSQAQLRVSQSQDSLESQMSRLESSRDSFRVLLHIDQNRDIILDDDTEITTEDIDNLVSGEASTSLMKSFHPRIFEQKQMVATALDKRLEIEQARLRSETSRLNEQVAHNGKGPSLDVVAQFNLDDSGSRYERSFYLRRPRYLYGLEFSYPIGNISEREAYTSARISRRLNEINEAQIEESIVREVRDRVRQVKLTERRVHLLMAGLEVAAFAYNGNRIRYEAGDIDFRLFSDAQRDLIDQLIDFFSVLMDYEIELVRLDKATGQLDIGRWVPEQE